MKMSELPKIVKPVPNPVPNQFQGAWADTKIYWAAFEPTPNLV